MSVLEYSTVSASGIKLQLGPQFYNFNSIHMCQKCKKYHTKSLFYIRNHVRRHLRQDIPFICGEKAPEQFFCKDCEFSTYLTIEFKKHLGSHCSKYCPKEISFTCLSYRKYVYKTETEIKDNWDNKNVGRIKCPLCSYKCKTNTHLQQHIIWKHASPHEIEWFHCDKCPFKSKTRGGLRNHVLRRHAETKTEIKDNWHIKNEGKIKCPSCTYECKTNALLQQHNVWKHASPHEIQWFHCDKCPFKSKMKGGLQNHVLHKHAKTKINTTRVEWFKCQSCTYKSKTKGNLQQHIVWKHASPHEIQWFHCANCPFKSKTKGGLQSHIFRGHVQSKRETKTEKDSFCLKHETLPEW